MSVIGLDTRGSFAVVASLEDGRPSAGDHVELKRDVVVLFGRRLRPHDEVVIEDTGNVAMIVHLLRPFGQRLVTANPLQVRLIAQAKVKIDKIDNAVLVKLLVPGPCLRSGWQTKPPRRFGVWSRSGFRSSSR